MMMPIRRIASWMVLPLMVAAGLTTAYADTSIVRNSDGSIVVTIDDREIVISTDLAASIAELLVDHGNDPNALETALRELVAANAGSADDMVLATAIAVYAILVSNGDSDVVTAIIDGTVEGNPSAVPQVLLSALTRSDPGVVAEITRTEPESQDTVEDPNEDISPV